jgi:hypothetical protein
MIMVCQIYFRHGYTTNGISSATGATGAAGAARNTLINIQGIPLCQNGSLPATRYNLPFWQ